MKHIAKNFQAYNDTWAHFHNIDVVEKQRQQTLYSKELCSIACMNNYALSENILSSNTIASKGFFQIGRAHV